MTSSTAVIIRQATAADEAALVNLATLDANSVPAGTVLVAEQDGELRAAISVETGHTVADPFHATAEYVAMLRYSREAHAGDRRTPRSVHLVRTLLHRRVALS